MFTGIVDHTGKIISIDKKPNALRLGIACNFQDLQLGESIAIDGCCLTVLEPQAKLFYCDVSPETLNITNLKQYQINTEANLERAMRLSDRLGGHLVMGHVDQTCQVANKKIHAEFTELQFTGLLPAAKTLFVKKGCVTVNGVSLTINELTDNGFTVMLIPHTLEITNLKNLQPNDYVNIEYDWLMKTIVNQLSNRLEDIV